MYQTQLMTVADSSRIGEARRFAMALAEQAGFDGTDKGRFALIVTELSHNLVRHGGGGSLLFNHLVAEELSGLEVTAVDLGQGMADINRCLEDGYSTAGTQGQGLGASMRQASEFDIFSQPGRGTAVVARLWSGLTHRPAPPRPELGCTFSALALPLAGEVVSGDGWASATVQGRSLLMVVDGLGHGLLAATASRTAVKAFAAATHLPVEEILKVTHAALISTRGAAAAIAEIRPGQGEVRFVGIGNISGTVLSSDGSSKSMVSLSGIVGQHMHKVQSFSYPWPSGATLLMHSDGLATSWQMTRYPGLLSRDPALLTAVLWRDFSRGRDDVTVVAWRADQLGRFS